MNWWLMAVAFVLGVVLTAAFLVYRPAAETTGPAQAPELPADPVPEPEPANVTPPETNAEAEAEPEPESDPPPHGPGSARPDEGGRGPQGWTVKANEESRLYHSPESPSFGVTRAEVWFRDVETAEAAGFNRWDSGKSRRGFGPLT